MGLSDALELLGNPEVTKFIVEDGKISRKLKESYICMIGLYEQNLKVKI